MSELSCDMTSINFSVNASRTGVALAAACGFLEPGMRNMGKEESYSFHPSMSDRHQFHLYRNGFHSMIFGKSSSSCLFEQVC